MRNVFALATCLVVLSATCRADVTLGSPFSSHMVLQRGINLPVWGWAESGEAVTVKFREQTQTATAAADGKWSVTLTPEEVGEPTTLSVAGKNTVTLEDVVLGEVWVCSGQSNMEWRVNNALDPDLESLAANFPNIRLYTVENTIAHEPATTCKGEWLVCNPESARNFSAVGYFFGRQLHQTLGVPVGVISADWGGTPAEAWTSPSFMTATTELKPILDTWAQRDVDFASGKTKADYDTVMSKWKEQAELALKDGQPEPGGKPRPFQEPRKNPHFPSCLYNGMIAPIAPYAIKGAIWYQGESNAGRAYQYRLLMPTMIKSWRDTWKQGDFPFYQVQLANYLAIKDEPGESNWAELREAQMLAGAAIPNVGAACITDLGAAKDIHPKDKQNVAKRLIRLALVNDYGRTDLVKQGPIYKSVEVQSGKCVVTLDNFGSKLISYYQLPLVGFTIAGADKVWKKAEAKIVGQDTVEVSSPDVNEPVAVRYNWADNPQGTLYSEAYLPAYPFRTDDWEGITVKTLSP